MQEKSDEEIERIARMSSYLDRLYTVLLDLPKHELARISTTLFQGMALSAIETPESTLKKRQIELVMRIIKSFPEKAMDEFLGWLEFEGKKQGISI